MVNFVQVLRRVFGEHQLWRFPLQFPFMQRGNDCEKTGGLHLWERCEPIFFMLGFGQYHQGQTTHLYCAPYRDLAQPLPFSKTMKQMVNLFQIQLYLYQSWLQKEKGEPSSWLALCMHRTEQNENKGSLPGKKSQNCGLFSVHPLAPPPPRIYRHLWGSFF